jgi:hypothetical protein
LKKDVAPARCACTTAHDRDFEEPLAIDGQIASLPKRPDQLVALLLEHLARNRCRIQPGGGEQHGDAVIGAGGVLSAGDPDAWVAALGRQISTIIDEDLRAPKVPSILEWAAAAPF